MVVYGDVSSDCGIWVARHLLPAVRGYRFGDYWFGLVINSIIVLCSHILDHCDETGRAHTAFAEMHSYVQQVRQSHPLEDFHVLAGSDFNVQLPSQFEDLTGTAIF